MAVANKRLANKVLWSLEDIDTTASQALQIWEKARERAQLKSADPALLLALAEIKSALADIRILATVARGGEYAGKRFAVYEDDEES